MAGLYIREMLSRRLLRRVLIVVPAGLVGNWQRELATLFNLQFRIVQGQDARSTNPFTGNGSDLIIVSVDTLAGAKIFGRLRGPDTLPYDLVIFDEAHKLSADRGADLRVRKTDRYKLAEAIAGITDVDEGWRLPWSAHHMLLLTATPHMGKDYPYYALWRLLQPSILTTPEAFQEYPRERRQQHFIRRTKEEMVFLDERPMYPRRVSDTLGYDLTEGEVSEQRLYDETTDYLQFIYNKAKMLNREAARLAMSVFQRRLASSTWALLRSFERRLAKLDDLITNVQEGKLTSEQLVILQRRLHEDDDVLESKTADEEATADGREENEVAEDNLLQGVIATSLADLVAEREQVDKLRDLAQRVYDLGHESKFDKLREAATDPEWADEKLIIFTEHKDKARNGNRAAQQHLAEVKQQQRDLAKRRAHALRVMRREPELISPSGITFIAHALVVPSSDPKDLEQHDAKVERVAMDLAWAYEESSGAIVKDVHTPALARAAGLNDNPGFDLLSIYPNGEKRSIEVKGRAGVGEVEVSRNEWGRACNLGDEYWLYVVYNCATDSPDLRRIQDPFVNLLTKAKGSVLISPNHVLAASSGDVQ